MDYNVCTKASRSICRCTWQARCCSSVTATRRKAMASWTVTRSKRDGHRVHSEPYEGQQFAKRHPSKTTKWLIASDIANSLPEALQQATTELVSWLERDYKLSANEAAIVGHSIRR